MHPAYSVIFFTVATGAGYGLLALLGVMACIGILPQDFRFGVVGLGLSLGLITAGLLASTAHLGRPERAWRAFSQWRSSWLSREGIAAVATYVPAAFFGVGWVLLRQTDGWVAVAGILAAIGAMATVCATGMIYASLKPVGQWSSPYTLPGYVIFSIMTGSVLLNALEQSLGGAEPKNSAVLPLLVTLVGAAWKAAAWRHNDGLEQVSTPNTATGLTGGRVRSVEWPHTQENYLLKEMGFRVARKHQNRLRLVAMHGAFVLPILLLAGSYAIGAGLLAIVLSLIAVILQSVGMLVERWLFFAEARHTVTLYYG